MKVGQRVMTSAGSKGTIIGLTKEADLGGMREKAKVKIDMTGGKGWIWCDQLLELDEEIDEFAQKAKKARPEGLKAASKRAPSPDYEDWGAF